MERISAELGPGIFASRDPEAQQALERFLREGVTEVHSDGTGVHVLAIR
jgi:hypothetical protein